MANIGKVRPMREPVYRVHYQTRGCRLQGRVNDCPAFKASGKRGLDTFATVNGWLHKGDNALRIEVTPPRGEDRLDQGAAHLRGKVTAADMTDPREGRDEVVLVEFELDLSADEGTYPLEVVEEFEVPTAFPRWLWQDAPTLTVDDAFQAEATRVVQRAWDALDRNDLTTVLGMQVIRNRELAQAMFQRPDEREADVRSDLGRLTGDDTSTLRPLDPSAFEFTVWGGGRLARVEDGRGNAVLRWDFRETTAFACTPVLLARKPSGELAWVR